MAKTGLALFLLFALAGVFAQEQKDVGSGTSKPFLVSPGSAQGFLCQNSNGGWPTLNPGQAQVILRTSIGTPRTYRFGTEPAAGNPTTVDLSTVGLHRAICVENTNEGITLARYPADDASHHNDVQRSRNARRMENRAPVQLSFAANGRSRSWSCVSSSIK